MINVVEAVKSGLVKFEWHELRSKYNGHTLFIKVFRDAMKFDGVPAMTWNYKPIPKDNRIFSGVRLPASAHQLQEIADLLGCMLLTPKVIDMIWLQAGLKFDSIINIKGNIVAISHIHDVHQAIENQIAKLGGDDGTQLVSCVGKYWCLINELNYRGKIQGDETSCNYGWCAKYASGPGITPGVQCWQRPGFRHNKLHYDPSQTIRLMHRTARLIKPDGTERKIDLHEVVSDASLAPLIHHQGVLTYLRQKGVSELQALPKPDLKLPSETVPLPEPEIIQKTPVSTHKSEPKNPQLSKNWLEIILSILKKLIT